MLRWTCRLRNVLETRDHVETFPGPLPEIREAEFVSSGSGTFPDEFRWDTFQATYDRLSRCAIYLDSSVTRTSRPLFWQEHLRFSASFINILWLSSTIFISPIMFCSNDTALHEYRIVFHDRPDWWSSTQVLVYSLSAFQAEEVREPSLLPLLFLTHLTATLAADYFSELYLQREKNKLHFCPVDGIILFLSIMSSSDIQLQVTPEEMETTFGLSYSDVNADELRLILSHHFRPTAKLAIDSTGVDATVSLDIMVDSLKKFPHLRAI
jgi:hypothetical protein